MRDIDAFNNQLGSVVDFSAQIYFYVPEVQYNKTNEKLSKPKVLLYSWKNVLRETPF